ncbi:MAG: hypothetical protein QUS14_12620 [Pyrinomonadaceae bacterium]|nr:hypothetical protein [Pyrinomonadaceae bacterium]
MLDENLIATLETSLRQTRNAQHRLMARLRDVEAESDRLREEIQALENSASQTESAIDSLLVTMRSGNHFPAQPQKQLTRTLRFEDEFERLPEPSTGRGGNRGDSVRSFNPNPSVAYINQPRVPSRSEKIEPISHRFADRTITQACTLLLREAGRPLHVNELYNLLVAGGMEFKGNNPTISVAVSLNRNRRFRKVEPGTFDLAIREASKLAS